MASKLAAGGQLPTNLTAWGGTAIRTGVSWSTLRVSASMVACSACSSWRSSLLLTGSSPRIPSTASDRLPGCACSTGPFEMIVPVCMRAALTQQSPVSCSSTGKTLSGQGRQLTTACYSWNVSDGKHAAREDYGKRHSCGLNEHSHW